MPVATSFKRALILLAGAAISASATTEATASTLLFQNGAAIGELGISSYSGTQNLTLIGGSNAGRNYGSSNSLWAGKSTATEERRILLRFDLSSLAAKANEVGTVTLTLTMLNQSGSNPGSIGISFFAINNANAGWVQGTASGAVQAGSSSWSYLVSNTQTWAGSAGLSTAGADYLTPALVENTSITIGASGVQGTRYSWELPVDLVKQWITGTNAGLLITAADPSQLVAGDYFRFASATYGTADYRPELAVTLIPEPGSTALAASALVFAGGWCWRTRRKQA